MRHRHSAVSASIMILVILHNKSEPLQLSDCVMGDKVRWGHPWRRRVNHVGRLHQELLDRKLAAVDDRTPLLDLLRVDLAGSPDDVLSSQGLEARIRHVNRLLFAKSSNYY